MPKTIAQITAEVQTIQGLQLDANMKVQAAIAAAVNATTTQAAAVAAVAALNAAIDQADTDLTELKIVYP